MTRTLACVAIFLLSFGLLVERVSGPGLRDPAGGDERDYEALAYNLWKGRGFGYFWSDPEWRAPYLQAPSSIEGLESGYYPTTYRPPAFPALWALTYAVAGRDLGAIRFVNAALMAGAIAMAAAVAWHFGGLAAALLAGGALLFTPDITIFARERLTEALATFLLSLLVWLWVSSSGRAPSIRTAVATGVVLGVLILSRSIFALCLPVALFTPAKRAGPRDTRRSTAIVLCVLACLVVVVPWWTRNVLVTDTFLPMGTQGSINLPAGFSQRALDNEGRWRSNQGDGAQQIVDAGIDPFSIEYEVRLAKHRAALTRTWMWDHPREVVKLMGLHVWQEFRWRRGRTDWTLLLPAVLVAFVYFRRHPGITAVIMVFIATLTSVALTWGVTGRFLVPLQPATVAVVSAMAVSVVKSFARPMWSWLAGSERSSS